MTDKEIDAIKVHFQGKRFTSAELREFTGKKNIQCVIDGLSIRSTLVQISKTQFEFLESKGKKYVSL